MPSEDFTIFPSSGYTIPEVTQKVIKDIFKSALFDSTSGFKYYEYDWNSQSFKSDNVPHPEQLKVIFPKVSIDSSVDYSDYFVSKMHVSYVDKEILELGIFPKLKRTNDGYDLCMYYNNFQNLTNCINLQFPYYSNSFSNAFLIYIGNYGNKHYFVVLSIIYHYGFWIVAFDVNNRTISIVKPFVSIASAVPFSRIYKYFDGSSNSLQLFYFGIIESVSEELPTFSYTSLFCKININLSDFSASFHHQSLPTHQYLIERRITFVLNPSFYGDSIISQGKKSFTYYFEDFVKRISSTVFNDFLFLSFWNPAEKPEELKIVLLPFTFNLSNNALSYHSPIEKKYNPLQITPKIYKYTSGENEFLYVNPPNNNYDYFIDGVSSKIDELTLILRNLDETNFNFEVIGYKTFYDENLNNSHAITTVDYCYTETCKTVYSMYYGVGGFYGHYLVTKKSDRFLFVFVPQIYSGPNNTTKHASVTYVYDLQSPLPNNYEPPSSETDIPRIARNPWFVEFTHSGLERWELMSNDETYGPIYKNSKKIYLWGNVLVNYPFDGRFSINIESLFRGDGFLYPRNVLLALPALQNFSQTFVGSLHSPFATGSFLSFKDVKSTQSLDSNASFVLRYLYSPDLSSFAFTAFQGSDKIPIAIFSILNDKKPRLYKWFNIYGNISFFNTRRAFAPSRGFFSGSLLKPSDLPTNRNYKKVSNFYPLFSLDFPKLFGNLYRVVTFSSYIEGRDVKVNTIKSRYITLDSRISVNFYFYPDAPQRYEVRGIDATGNFYFTILNQANFLFLPAHYSDSFEIGSLISINYNGVSYVYEIVDIDTFTGVIVDDSGWPWDFDVYLLMRVDSL
jgi:hypothetical protein